MEKQNLEQAKLCTYAGRFKTEEGNTLHFGLYGYDDIVFVETKTNILNNLQRNHLKNLKKLFSTKGLTLQDLTYYSPRAYNFENDNIDLKISIHNKKKLLAYIEAHKEALQKALSANKSYDGYTALTASSVQEITEDIQNKDDVDIMVINLITAEYPLSQEEDFNDLLVFDETIE